MARPGKPAELLKGMRYEEPADLAEPEKMIAPFAAAVARLDEIPGVGTTAARAIIAEVPLPHAAHLASVLGGAQQATHLLSRAGLRDGVGLRCKASRGVPNAVL